MRFVSWARLCRAAMAAAWDRKNAVFARGVARGMHRVVSNEWGRFAHTLAFDGFGKAVHRLYVFSEGMGTRGGGGGDSMRTDALWCAMWF